MLPLHLLRSLHMRSVTLWLLNHVLAKQQAVATKRLVSAAAASLRTPLSSSTSGNDKWSETPCFVLSRRRCTRSLATHSWGAGEEPVVGLHQPPLCDEAVDSEPCCAAT